MDQATAMDRLYEARERIAVLEAALLVTVTQREYPDLVGFHSGVRSVYGQAVYEDRKEMAEWMLARWPAALTA